MLFMRAISVVKVPSPICRCSFQSVSVAAGILAEPADHALPMESLRNLGVQFHRFNTLAFLRVSISSRTVAAA
jgi:hypothetical protein